MAKRQEDTGDRQDQCMSPRSAQRFWDNDMHRDKDLARRLDPFQRDAL
jgi:hypothetical protein